jgi:hypothetical protein
MEYAQVVIGDFVRQALHPRAFPLIRSGIIGIPDEFCNVLINLCEAAHRAGKLGGVARVPASVGLAWRMIAVQQS